MAQVSDFNVMPNPVFVKCKTAECVKFEKTDLAFAYRTQLVKAGGRPPGAFATGVATKQLKRNDCDRDDSCLKQLAQLARTPYALYTDLDVDKDNFVVMTGRVVSDEGKRAREAMTVRLPKGKEPLADVVQVALGRLFEQLKVKELSVPKAAVAEVKTPDIVKPPTEPVKPIETLKTPEPTKPVTDVAKVEPTTVTDMMPPPMPTVETKSSAAPIGLLVGGTVVALAGGIIWGVGAGQMAALKINDGALPIGRRDSGTTQAVNGSLSTQTVGAVALGVGGVAAVSGLVWLLTQEKGEAPKSTSVTFGIAPTGNGGMASIQGSF